MVSNLITIVIAIVGAIFSVLTTAVALTWFLSQIRRELEMNINNIKETLGGKINQIDDKHGKLLRSFENQYYQQQSKNENVHTLLKADIDTANRRITNLERSSRSKDISLAQKINELITFLNDDEATKPKRIFKVREDLTTPPQDESYTGEL